MAEPIDVDHVKKQGWQQDNILVVSLNDPRLNMIEREFVKMTGEKLYGTKRSR